MTSSPAVTVELPKHRPTRVNELAHNSGRRIGGRGKNTPNKLKANVRLMFQSFVEGNITRAQELFDRVAEKDPTMALKLLLEASEFCVPKLARTELVGDPNAPMQVAHTVSAERLEEIRQAALAPRLELIR